MLPVSKTFRRQDASARSVLYRSYYATSGGTVAMDHSIAGYTRGNLNRVADTVMQAPANAGTLTPLNPPYECIMVTCDRSINTCNLTSLPAAWFQ